MDAPVPVLLVDDRPENLEALHALLDQPGRELVHAHDGQQALMLCRSQPFAVVLLDVQMPGMSGFEVAELLRGRRATKTLPILFVTANADSAAAQLRGYEAGAVDYITKPLNPVIVRSKVQVFEDLYRQGRELTQLTQLLEARNEVLKRSNRDLTDFASLAAHDIQAPLRTVSMLLDVLDMQRDVLDEDGQNLLDLAVSAAARGDDLVNGLLAYATLGEKELSIEATDLSDTVAQMRQALAADLAQAEAIVTSAQLPRVSAEPGLMLNLITNLVGNALKYRSDRPPRVELSAVEHPPGWRIDVVDNGRGIGPAHIARVFGLFQRGDAGEGTRGHGLGLATCARIVERHGGRIGVDSVEGEGSRFWFTLPSE